MPTTTTPPSTSTHRRAAVPCFVVLAVLVVLAMLAGAATLGYRWTQTQFYVAPDDAGMVAIYRGIPQQLGPISLSTLEETSDLAVADLPPFVQDRVEAGISAGSLEEAHETVDGLAADSAEPGSSTDPDESESAEDPSSSESAPADDESGTEDESTTG